MRTFNQDTQAHKTALITGATGGIGYETAKLFARDKYNLVLVARGEQRLKELGDELTKEYGITVMALAQDLAKLGASEEIFSNVQQQSITIDVLVNNAGFGSYGFFAESDLTKEMDMIQVNINALTHLTKLFLPGMLQRKSGKILNVASTAAFFPGPIMAVYYASKAYVLSFSEAIANELKGTGVTVTALCPGPTRTGFQSNAAVGNARLFESSQLMSAETVAKVGYKGLMRGKTVVIPGLTNQLMSLSPRFTPRNLTTSIVRYFQQSPKSQGH
ncbi:MAG: SDR family oxidoreductase [Chloroflexi bacterium]|nr:SDR family oxidoreductase [Chloroflexota bacterium]MDA1220179.1 SDR family oxidoreductase [Chloroflexota bacterium]